MAKRNVVDFKIINLSEEKFQELKEAGQIDPNALYCTPDTTKDRLTALESTKANDSDVVHKTDNETIGGEKTFTNIIKMQGQYLHFYGIDSASTQSFRDIDAYDTNGKIVGGFRIEHSSISGHSVSLITRKADGSVGGILGISTKPDGTYSSFAPTPASTSNSTEIATTAWANAKFLPLVGGTITGAITTKSQIFFENATSTGNRGFLYKTSDGTLSMGISKSDNSGWQSYQSFFTNGQYAITVSDGTNSKQLSAKPDGTLTWDGEDVATTKAKSLTQNGYVKFNNGLIIQWGQTDSAGTTSVAVTLPTPFTSNNYKVATSNLYNSTTYGASTLSHTTTGFTIYRNKDVDVYWIAIGY